MQPDPKPPTSRRRESVSDVACAAATGVRASYKFTYDTDRIVRDTDMSSDSEFSDEEADDVLDDDDMHDAGMMITTRKAYELVYDSLTSSRALFFMLTLSSSCHRQILTSLSLPSSRSRVLGLRYVLLRPSRLAHRDAVRVSIRANPRSALHSHEALHTATPPSPPLLVHLASSALPAFVVPIALVAFIAFFTRSSAAGPSVFQVPRVTVSAVGYHIPRAGVL
ncbi:hypothetical protein B0H11DRAFT_2430898 [Mycena galericulata]|nr:hypothetical protein B0H11DRAFT_2430898 [Mycena galericulata]